MKYNRCKQYLNLDEKLNRYHRNSERYGRRNRHARSQTRQIPPDQGGDDAGVVDGEGEVGVRN